MNIQTFKRANAMRTTLILVFASLAMACAAETQTATNAYGGPRYGLLDPAKVMDAAKSITVAAYPDCDDAIVEKKMVRTYRPDGTGECQDETYTKVLTEKGKRGNRSISLYYMLPYSTAEAIKLEVIRPGGEHTSVDIAANSKEMIDDSQMGMNIYDPNSKILRVSIPKVEVGDVVHSVTRTTILRSVIPGEFADDNTFEGPGYIRHLSYTVYAPEGRPLKKIFLRDEVKGTVKYKTEGMDGGESLHSWEVTDVPRMFDEPSMPPYETVLQRLLISTTSDWQSVSKWYWNVCKPHLDATTPEMQKQVDELTANAKTDLEKTKAVFYYVAQKIRYMGLTPEKDRPGFEPHDVKLTFSNKYGVCRDKAALLVAMLKAAGCESFPVLVSVGSKKDTEVPEPSFNHAIVGVETPKGHYVLMDPTAENTKDLLPSYECDQSYLVCRPEGETIRLSPIIPPEDNMMRVRTTASLDAAGVLDGKCELWFDGINDNAYRETFSRMKPDDKRRFFERAVKRVMPGARLKSLKIFPEDVQDVSAELRAELEFSADGMTAPGQGKAIVSLPWIGKGMGVVNFILGGTGLDKRKYPMRTDIACGLKEEIEVKLAPGFTGAVSIPSYSPIVDEALGYQRKVEFANSTLVCSGELKLKQVEFSPAEYLKLKKTLKAMEYDERKTPVLAVSNSREKEDKKVKEAAPAVVESNARIIESEKNYEIKSPHSSVLHGHYVKQVLNYSGKKSEAEFKLGFNPSCEEVKLVRAIVTSKEGKKQEIATNEVNIMDAGWNASARRYTGGKTLVANLPAVDVGSRIEIEYEVTSKDKPFLAGFEPFQTFDDLDKKHVRLTAPAGVKVHTKITGPAGLVKEAKSSGPQGQLFDWRSESVKALPSEGQLPPEWFYMAGAEYSIGDASQYWKELNAALLDRSQKNSRVAELTRKLVGKSKKAEDTVRAIRDFVSKSIRPAGPSFAELPLGELSAADTTLGDGYGHMADRAILLHAMLTAAGLKPQFVLASGFPELSEITSFINKFPLPQNFQSVLVRVPLNGDFVYLNDTDQYAELGSTGYDGRLAIMLNNGSMEVIKATSSCHDKTETSYTLSMADDGKTRVGITHLYYGENYNSKNRYFSELPPEERKRYFQEIVSGFAQGARAVSDLKTKFDAYPGLEQYTIEVDNYSVVDGKYSYFDLPFTPSLFALGADTRTLPLFISHKNQFTVRTEIDLPPGFPQIDIAPPSIKYRAPDGAGQINIKATDSPGKRVTVHEFQSFPAIVSARDYPEMLKIESELRRKSSRVFLLEGSMIPIHAAD
jgi:transglutaminase-like putative cysteine protease